MSTADEGEGVAGDTPLGLVTAARSGLKSFQERLLDLPRTIRETPGFAHTVMQCRDADQHQFDDPSSVEARSSAMVTAEQWRPSCATCRAITLRDSVRSWRSQPSSALKLLVVV